MKFRLESLLRLRKNEEDQIQREFGVIQAHLHNQEQELVDMESREKRNKEELNQIQGQPQNPSTFMMYDRYFQSVKVLEHRQRQVISEIHSKADKKRKHLIEAVRQRRTLEILKERELLRHRKEQAKRETALLDEVASAQWHMKKR